MLELIRRWVLSPLVGEVYVREVAIAPEALVGRLQAAIAARPRRALGVLKVHAEWMGVVAGKEFTVWERQQHATVATGTIRGRRGGSRIEAHIRLRRRTWVLMCVFFVLFVAASIGLLSRQEGLGMSPGGFTVAALGAFVTLTLFWSGSLRQRAALKAFRNEVFRGPEPA